MFSGKGEQYHLIGAAGVGMSSVAQALLFRGCSVSGSDRYFDEGRELDVIRKLESAGLNFVPQNGSGVISSTRAVIVSTAIEDDNPDVVAANALGVKILHRSEILAQLVDGVQTVAVTGTSGKSTVTGMIGWILECLGAAPCVVNGAPVLNWLNNESVGNARAGDGELWVIEADESDRSLLNYHPDWAVVTNASKDHFDLDETLKLFSDFCEQVGKGVISTIQDPDILSGLEVRSVGEGLKFIYGEVEFTLNIPGRHNAEDALLAVMICEKLGFNLEEISSALSGFKGIHRRLEIVGSCGGVRVIDDYGHNPEKISAAWRTVTEQWGGRVILIWRPHGFGPLASMMDELVHAFQACSGDEDLVYVLPVYDAGGTADRSIGSGDLVARLSEEGVCSEVVDDYDSVISVLKGRVQSGDTIITMGARDPGLPDLAKRILASVTQT